MQPLIKAGICLTTLISIIFVLNKPIGSIPPLGKFLSPYTGYTSLIHSDKLPAGELHFDSLSEPVSYTHLTLPTILLV